MSRKKFASADAAPAIAERLKVFRESQGMSVRSMATRIGVSASFLSDIEAGKRRPSFETITGAVSAGADAAWLLTGVERAPAREAEPSDPRLAELVREIDEWWTKTDDDQRAWLRVEFRRMLKGR